MTRTIIALIVAWLWIIAPAAADTLYTWTDADGVTWFSNDPPPEHITDFETINTRTGATGDTPQGAQRRPGFDQMVEQATDNSDRLRKKREAREARAKERQLQRAEERRKARIASKRRQLEKQIAEIKNRAVSPTYPQGMKDAQIEELQKRIDQLEQ